MAHKKAAGSAKNLRTSKPKYRGVKVFGGQTTTKGAVIIRQKGDKFKCGANTFKGRDFTIHASVDGIVSFKKKKTKRYDGRTYLKTYVEVVSATEEKPAPTAKKAAKKVVKAVKATKTEAKTLEKKAAVAKKAAPAKKTAKATKTVKKTGADDLKKIEGIGPKIAEVLTEAGIGTFAALANTSPDAIREILEAASSRYKMFDPTTRPEQAKMAAEGRWDELKKRQDELDGGK